MMPNMFEFSIALRYLLPNRNQKTLSFVGLFASMVIAVVLWLLIVFISITQSIQDQWLNKMTALSAPLRVKPTKAYFQSYFYQIDQYTEASNYRFKSLREKLHAELSDPYNPELDENISHLPLPHRDFEGQLVDPVKQVFSILDKKQKTEHFTFQDYSLSAGALHLNCKKDGQTQTLNQILYVTSYAKDALNKGAYIESWDLDDVNYLLKNDSPDSIWGSLDDILNRLEIRKIKMTPFSVQVPKNLASHITNHKAVALYNAEGMIKKVMLVNPGNKSFQNRPDAQLGMVDLKNHTFNGQSFLFSDLYLDELENIELESAKSTPFGRKFLVKASYGKKSYHLELSAQDFAVTDFVQKIRPQDFIKPLLEEKNHGAPFPILAPKCFKEQGAKIGDKGYISYGAKTLSGFQEMKAPLVVAGFYDPGIFSVGAKILIGSFELIDLIGNSATTYALDPGEINGILVFCQKFQDAKAIKATIQKELDKNHISSYFEVQTYDNYPFVKEILEQFSSDKLIFYLVAIIIFIVALSNVSFLMQLLVRDKSHDMAILRSLGAPLKAVRRIFINAGLLMGLLSASLATLLSTLTLKFLQPILDGLKFLLGSESSLTQFYAIASKVSMDPKTVIALFATAPCLCALAAYLATANLKNKSCAQFLKEPK
jgi:lipoprotein-releasing system permease protein